MRELRFHDCSSPHTGTVLPPIPSSAPRSTGTARDVSPSRLRLKAGGVGANNRANRGAEDGAGTAGPSLSINTSLQLHELFDSLAVHDRGDARRVAIAELLRVPDLDVIE